MCGESVQRETFACSGRFKLYKWTPDVTSFMAKAFVNKYIFPGGEWLGWNASHRPVEAVGDSRGSA